MAALARKAAAGNVAAAKAYLDHYDKQHDTSGNELLMSLFEMERSETQDSSKTLHPS